MLRLRTGIVCLAFLLAALPGAVLAQSQATTGVIEGVVSDEGGAPLPGAAVALRNIDTNFEKATTTSTDGRFRAVLLPLGPYKVDKSGAQTAARPLLQQIVRGRRQIVWPESLATAKWQPFPAWDARKPLK